MAEPIAREDLIGDAILRLRNSNANTRISAIDILMKMQVRDERIVPAIISALSDKNASARMKVLRNWKNTIP